MLKKGFTLLELLITAALVGVLTVAATRTFRTVRNDVNKENAKQGARAVAAAATRFQAEYPNASFATSALQNPRTWKDMANVTCNPKSDVTIETLVACNLLENRTYIPDGFSFEFSSGPTVVVKSGSATVFQTTGYDEE